MDKIIQDIRNVFNNPSRFLFALSISLWLLVAAIICLVSNYISWSFAFAGIGLLSSIATLILAIKEKE